MDMATERANMPSPFPGAFSLAGAVEERAVKARRQAEIIRKGMVTAIDESGPEPLFTVNGREMRIVETNGVVVGSVVYYLDQKDPIGFGKPAGT